jgi:hypothetical protein
LKFDTFRGLYIGKHITKRPEFGIALGPPDIGHVLLVFFVFIPRTADKPRPTESPDNPFGPCELHDCTFEHALDREST